MRKKTHEEYVAELAIKNPDIEVVEQYVGNKNYILHRCKKCGYEWRTAPQNVLKGKGCPKCLGKLKKTHDDYVDELKFKNIMVEPIEEYINAKTPILHKCLIHNILWKSSPTNILQGKGCPQCLKEKQRKIKAKDIKDYITELKNVNPFVILVGDYVNARTKTLHKCLKHNIEWMIRPEDALKGRGCQICKKEKYSLKRKKSHDQYLYEVSKVNPDILVLEQYQGDKVSILHKCLKHNITWKVAPSQILRGCGCSKCRSEKISEKAYKTHEQYVEDVKNINPDILVIEKYIDVYTPILHKCLKDGCEWYAKPLYILQGSGCPQCNESSGERVIRQTLEKYKIRHQFQKIFQNCRDKNVLPFDFYLPNYNIAIEYQGQQHYEVTNYFGGEKHFKIQQLHDKIKFDYCEDNYIQLICIPYWEFNNIENIILDYLKLYKIN